MIFFPPDVDSPMNLFLPLPPSPRPTNRSFCRNPRGPRDPRTFVLDLYSRTALRVNGTLSADWVALWEVSFSIPLNCLRPHIYSFFSLLPIVPVVSGALCFSLFTFSSSLFSSRRSVELRRFCRPGLPHYLNSCASDQEDTPMPCF